MNGVHQVHTQPLTLSEATQQMSADKATASWLMIPLYFPKKENYAEQKKKKWLQVLVCAQVAIKWVPDISFPSQDSPEMVPSPQKRLDVFAAADLLWQENLPPLLPRHVSYTAESSWKPTG